ncbi:ATP-dependent DNA helicase PIF6-like [Puccinia sorghi]|uniref:ATP-dependent DNA helicase PIF6-like n=1 Tax=Puccinia sorghi TaxID=27349 RepID=A0A0L6VAZ7_9BASI|nr:ATP-dependent DNA helicase PIF6-like [Puccinia sorghi]
MGSSKNLSRNPMPSTALITLSKMNSGNGQPAMRMISFPVQFWPPSTRQVVKAHSIDSSDDQVLESLTPESLYHLNFPRFPPHQLLLKVWMPIILVRNLNIVEGLRIHFWDFQFFTIMHSYIPKINLPCVYTDQFPVMPCFSMTINKIKGKNLSKVIVLLKSPVFSHGQSYFSLSHATNQSNLDLLQSGDTSNMLNVLYKDLVTLFRGPSVSSICRIIAELEQGPEKKNYRSCLTQTSGPLKEEYKGRCKYWKHEKIHCISYHSATS